MTSPATCKGCHEPLDYPNVFWCSLECLEGAEVRDALRPVTNADLIAKANLSLGDLAGKSGTLDAPAAARFYRMLVDRSKVRK